jgi:hypothetical protein
MSVGYKTTRFLAVIILTLGVTAAAAQPKPQVKLPPGPKALPWLGSVTLNKTTTTMGAVGGGITGTVRLLRPAIQGGVIVSLSPCFVAIAGGEGGAVTATLTPTSLTIPNGQDSATFQIRGAGAVSGSAACHVTATHGDETKTASFTIETLKVASMTVLPPAGLGPFTAAGTVTLSARPIENTMVTLTSSNPLVVRFGTIGNAQDTATRTFTSSNNNPQTFSLVASSVTSPVTVTIAARLGGQTVTHQVTVRPPLN